MTAAGANPYLTLNLALEGRLETVEEAAELDRLGMTSEIGAVHEN